MRDNLAKLLNQIEFNIKNIFFVCTIEPFMLGLKGRFKRFSLIIIE